MIRPLKKVLTDMGAHRFLNLITIATISLSILVVALFLLVFENAGRVMETWDPGGRAMVYLVPEFSEAMLPDLTAEIDRLGDVTEITFIPKSQALARLKKEMALDAQFFDTLKENPLPHALDVRMNTRGDFERVAEVAQKIQALDMVESVEYGQGWLARFLEFLRLFRLTGYILCLLFSLIAFFITAITVRLVFHTRQSEIEIMRLVGATNGFIKIPFYVTGMVQGFAGGVLGLLILFTAYLTVSSGISRSLGSYVYLDLRFLSAGLTGLILGASTFLGWFGCYLSLKQILK
jgi:cell division transport system permease protein